MKLLFISSDNNSAHGAFLAQSKLLQDLKEKGHEVAVILPYKGSGELILKEIGVEYKVIVNLTWLIPSSVQFFGFMNKAIISVMNIFGIKKLEKFIKEIGTPDLVVYNTVWTGFASKHFIKKRIPIVWHLREVITFQNHFFSCPKTDIKTMSKAQILLPVSSYVKNQYQCYFNDSLFKIIHDGVETKLFLNKNKILFQKEKIRFIMVGPIGKQKGQDIGIQTLNELSNLNFEVVLVGQYNKQSKKKLLQLGSNITDRIVFAGTTTNITTFYESSDILLMNSIGEGFGLVTVEAMMAGLLVIAADCGGTSEIISNESYGLLYKSRDYQDLKKKIVYATEHKEKMVEIARAGQKHAVESFSRNKNSQEIEKTYLEIINK